MATTLCHRRVMMLLSPCLLLLLASSLLPGAEARFFFFGRRRQRQQRGAKQAQEKLQQAPEKKHVMVHDIDAGDVSPDMIPIIVKEQQHDHLDHLYHTMINEHQQQQAASETKLSNGGDNKDGSGMEDIPWPIQYLGKELYKSLGIPKYRRYLHLMGYEVPSVETFIVSLNILCNLLYCTSILLGFWFLPRTPMLFTVLLTFLVGPVLILLGLGIVMLALGAFALYPLTSAVALWLWFFLQSHLFQVIGSHLGLDQDHDGDVDWLDVLYYISENTKVGRYLNLRVLHDSLNEATLDNYQLLHQRLNGIEEQMAQYQEQSTKNLLALSPLQNINRSNSVDDDDTLLSTPTSTPRGSPDRRAFLRMSRRGGGATSNGSNAHHETSGNDVYDR